MAKILKIYPQNPQENLIDEAVKVLQNGGVIIYPSDTIYTIGCDIYNHKAMERLAQIKGIKIDKQKMAERLKEDICRLVGKQEFDVAYARWLDLQIVLKDLGAGGE